MSESTSEYQCPACGNPDDVHDDACPMNPDDPTSLCKEILGDVGPEELDAAASRLLDSPPEDASQPTLLTYAARLVRIEVIDQDPDDPFRDDALIRREPVVEVAIALRDEHNRAKSRRRAVEADLDAATRALACALEDLDKARSAEVPDGATWDGDALVYGGVRFTLDPEGDVVVDDGHGFPAWHEPAEVQCMAAVLARRKGEP